MEQERVSLSIGVTINVKNFESVKVDAGYSSAIMPGETPDDAQERVETQVIAMLENRLAGIRNKVQETMHKEA